MQTDGGDDGERVEQGARERPLGIVGLLVQLAVPPVFRLTTRLYNI